MQSFRESLPTDEYLPDTQSVHKLAARLDEYFPVEHSSQSSSASLPSVGRYFPFGQLRQVPDEMAPGVLEYFPEEHATQSDSDVFPVDASHLP